MGPLSNSTHQNQVFRDSGGVHSAVCYQDPAVLIHDNLCRLPDMAFCNKRRDPGSRDGPLYNERWTIRPLQRMFRSHITRI